MPFNAVGVFFLFSLALRWLVYDYRRMAWLRSLMARPNLAILNELLQCVYCQTVEASIVVAVLLHYGAGWRHHPLEWALASLVNGLGAITVMPTVNAAIAALEDELSEQIAYSTSQTFDDALTLQNYAAHLIATAQKDGAKPNLIALNPRTFDIWHKFIASVEQDEAMLCGLPVLVDRGLAETAIVVYALRNQNASNASISD